MRKKDGGALTCDPIDRERAKCPKPFMCIASKCGLKFCCSNDSENLIPNANKSFRNDKQAKRGERG
jgi:hypothetical protein